MNYYINGNGAICAMPDDFLMHYGVKGMKWGVRRKQIRDGKADRSINQTSARRSANKALLDAKNKAAEARYYGGRAKINNTFVNRTLDKYDAYQLKQTKARNKVDFQLSELSDKYNIARQKARKDKSYKKTAEYKKARNDLGKSYLERYLLGDAGYMRVHTDINSGKSVSEAYASENAHRFISALLS